MDTAPYIAYFARIDLAIVGRFMTLIGLPEGVQEELGSIPSRYIYLLSLPATCMGFFCNHMLPGDGALSPFSRTPLCGLMPCITYLGG